jgi:REP element-mobilizing transposase RayT
MLDWNYSDDFQAVRFQPPDPYENRRDDGIQTERARGFRPEVPHNLVYEISTQNTSGQGSRACARPDPAICQARDVVIVRGAVSPDHIHLLLAAPPILAPAKLAQYIKGRSSRHLQAEFPELRKRYWGQHMWARGYFCATVGAVDEATIKAYIENQKWDEDDEGFKITAPTEP